MDPNIDTVGLVAFPPSTTPARSGLRDTCLDVSLRTTVTIVPAKPVDDSSPNNYDQREPGLPRRPARQSTSRRRRRRRPEPERAASSSTPGATTRPSGQATASRASARRRTTTRCRPGKAELDKDGRPGVPKVLIFMTDGEANMGSLLGRRRRATGYEPDLGDPATGFNMPPRRRVLDGQPGRRAAVPHGDQRRARHQGRRDHDLLDRLRARPRPKCVHGVWGQVDASAGVAAQNDWPNFKCVDDRNRPIKVEQARHGAGPRTEQRPQAGTPAGHLHGAPDRAPTRPTAT